MVNRDFIAVTTVENMSDRSFACFSVDGADLVIGRFREEFYAVENQCSHANSAFNNGRLRGYNLICPLHSGSFDIRDDGMVEVKIE